MHGGRVSDLQFDANGELRTYSAREATVSIAGKLIPLSTESYGIDLAVFRPPQPPPKPVGSSVLLHPFRFELESLDDRGTSLHIAARINGIVPPGIQVPDRTKIDFDLPMSTSWTGFERARKIRERVLWAITHELNECMLHADGEHVVQPHPEEDGDRHPEIEAMHLEVAKADMMAGLMVEVRT